ncbi:hypothetical protein VKT23_015478 [Stygiomarasmius scandens]|uniref:Uncharacterized protein n=1 Tax=Marasmiellus scandens TaxID=2682957 RepID=A0ABR1IY17_9AGAR
MIYDKAPPENPDDAPPSYDTLVQPQSQSQSQFQPDVKTPIPISVPTTPNSASSSSASYKGKGKAPASNSSWWPGSSFFLSQNARQTRTTVLGIIKDLVRGQAQRDSAVESILESCADACANFGLSFSELLQEKSIEGYTPVYWAIVNRSPSDEPGNENGGSRSDLLTSLLQYTSPLLPSTISEIRLACLQASDQELFKRLQMTPELGFARLSGTDDMVLGVGDERGWDDVSVEDIKGDDGADRGAFRAEIRIVKFQKRMRISKEVGVEFVARGRIWRLAFKVNTSRHTSHSFSRIPVGAWCAALSLMDNSPPTPVDSRLIIPEAAASTSSPASPSSTRTKLKPPITLRIQTPPSTELIPTDMGRHVHQLKEVIVPLSSGDTKGGAAGGGLEHAGSSYIGSDDSLTCQLEARLAKPEQDCVIC